MRKLLLLLSAFAFGAPAYAADNVAVTPGTGKTMACLDITTVCYSKIVVYDTTGAALFTSGNPGAVSLASVPSHAVTNVGTFPVQNTAATPAGTNVIGHVIVDTAPTTAVTLATAPALVASSAIIGKIGIDQTTPGTTNGIQINTALPAGTNIIGKAGIDQTTPGTTNGVFVTNTNPNGSAVSASSSPVVVASDQAAIPVNPTPYPKGATPYTASATGTTAATTATLTGAASVTTYICGFSIRANATAAATGNATVTGTITGTLNFTQWTAPLASGLGITEMVFSPCVPASAANTSVAVVSAAPGSGGVVSVSSWGYKL